PKSMGTFPIDSLAHHCEAELFVSRSHFVSRNCLVFSHVRVSHSSYAKWSNNTSLFRRGHSLSGKYSGRVSGFGAQRSLILAADGYPILSLLGEMRCGGA